jgi:hypothetical protein
MASLSPERRAHIQARAQELIESKMTPRNLRSVHHTVKLGDLTEKTYKTKPRRRPAAA